MKKSIIALAVAASVAGYAQADTTLYGSVRLSVEAYQTSYQDDGVDDYNNTDVKNNSSRFGIKGHEDLGNGLSAFYTYEFGINADKGSITDKDTNRLSFVGLKHDKWGAIALGAQWSPYYNTVGYNDIFNGSFSYDETYYLGKFRLSDVLAYVSPTWGGVQAQVGVVFNGEKDNTHDDAGSDAGADAVNASVNWSQGGWFVGGTYLWAKEGYAADSSAGSVDLYGATVGYENDYFRLGLVGEFLNTDEGDEDPYSVNIAGEYYLTDADTLRAGVGMLDGDQDGDDDDNSYIYMVGYQHDFSKRTRVWAEYAYLDAGDNFSDDDGQLDDRNMISLGIRTDF